MTYRGKYNDRAFIIYGGGGFCPNINLNNVPGNNCTIHYDSDDNTAFFGLVPAKDFITGSKLKSDLSLGGVVHEENVDWLKFWIDDRLVFYPRTSPIINLSYNDLDNSRVVDGRRSIAIKGRHYNVYLISGMDDGYNGPWSDTVDPPYSQRSEWNRLIYRICETNPRRNTMPNWAEFTEDHGPNGLGLTTPSVGAYPRTRNKLSTTQHVCRGGRELARFHISLNSTRDTNGAFRPLLELIQY